MRDEEGDVLPTGLEIVPLGSTSGKLLERIAAALSRRVAVPCRVAPVPPLALPRLSHRNQLDADRMLKLVEALPRRAGEWTVGIASGDMGHPIFTFFFGRAEMNGSAIVLSTARMDPTFYGLPADESKLVHRATVEALHELGHVAGLPHCEDNACVMRFCSAVEQIDNRGDTFCARCSPGLPPAFAPSLTTRA